MTKASYRNSIILAFLLALIHQTNAFSSTSVAFKKVKNDNIKLSTTTAPPREKTRTGRKVGSGRPIRPTRRDIDKGGPLEYLVDDTSLVRKEDDPFHILLLGSTFQKPRITTEYVSSSLTYVLDMPPKEAKDHAEFAAENGITCLGTWTRSECLSLGKQLQNRDLECRVVPFCEGGSRSWQAKSANDNNDNGNSPFENDFA